MKKGLLGLTLILAACQGGGDSNQAAAPVNGNASDSAGGPSPAGRASQTLAQFVAASPEHRQLARAVEAAGLAGTLSGAGPYTLFAPTDAAFAKLGAEGQALLQPDAKGRLTRLLVGHAVPGVVMAQDLGRAIDQGGGKAQLATLGGGTLAFSRSGDALQVADGSGTPATVTRADAAASNGVVHAVDTVLMPGEGR